MGGGRFTVVLALVGVVIAVVLAVVEGALGTIGSPIVSVPGPAPAPALALALPLPLPLPLPLAPAFPLVFPPPATGVRS